MKVTFEEDVLATGRAQRRNSPKKNSAFADYIISHSGGIIKSKASATAVMVLLIALSIGASVSILARSFGQEEVRPVPSLAVPLKSAR